MKEKIIKSNEDQLIQPLVTDKSDLKSRSHLKKTLTAKAKRNLTLIGIAGLLLIILGILFGPFLLVQYSLLLERNAPTPTPSKNDVTFINAPFLDPVESATNSAELIVSGTADSDSTVKIYINGKATSTIPVRDDGTFTTNVELKEGENSLKAKAFLNEDQSEFSEVTIIYFGNKPPDLDIMQPSDGQTLEKNANPMRVRGKTSQNTRVTVNGFKAITDDEGNFSYQLPLKPGGNEIIIIAQDEAGNKTEKKISVHLSE